MPSKLNRREQAVSKAAKLNELEVLDKGWPDYLLYDRITKQVIFLEVKSCTDEVRKHQKRMLKILAELGLDVRIVRLGRRMKEQKSKIKLAVSRYKKGTLGKPWIIE